MGGDHDVADLLEVADPADAVDQQRLAGGDHLAAADVGVVLLQGGADLAQGQAVLDQPFRGDDDVVLALQAAPGVDLGDAGNLAQLRLDHPVVQGAQLIEGALGIVGAQHVVEDLAQPGGDRPEFRALDPCRQFHGGQALHDQLSRIVDWHIVAEGHHHLRQAELGDRADADQMRQAGNCQFHRHGQLFFDLFRPEGRGDGVDLHLHRGGVGEGVDRQTRQGPAADGTGD